MYKSFESLPEEKREKIIAICIEEFAEKGYEMASTNTIIKKAEISKGILFHYFKNKKNLFLYILDLIMEKMKAQAYDSMKGLPSDFFERVFLTSSIKMKMSYENPEMYKILMDAYGNMPGELEKELKERYDKVFEEAIPFVMKEIDTSKFRKDIDPKRAIELLMAAMEGLSSMYMKQLKAMEDKGLSVIEKIEEIRECMEILKYGIYEKQD